MVGAITATASLVAVGTALAGSGTNDAPSRAPLVQIGVPVTGDFGADGNSGAYWWRLADVVRRGDILQLAVTNDGSPGLGVTQEINFCVTPPVDDFDAEGAVGACHPDGSIDLGTQRRFSITTSVLRGGFLVVLPFNQGSDGTYSFTLEAVVTRVNIGAAPLPAVSRRQFGFVAFATLGDNSATPTGTPGYLERLLPARPGRSESRWTRLRNGAVENGRLAFRATLPRSTLGRRVSLRACVRQPGGTSVRCVARRPIVRP